MMSDWDHFGGWGMHGSRGRVLYLDISTKASCALG